MASTNWYLLCYDIANNKRLQRLQRFMKDQGLPLQYSVFLLHTSSLELLVLLEAVRKKINEKEDDVRIYPISSTIEFLALGRQELGQGMTLTGDGLINLDIDTAPGNNSLTPHPE